ncbi:patatin-like phospholipase family protein [uncultured Tessaracoccus sp.]|uniref:patatin-like phospholipase family protein n=1 Tax=uncultured Tessaracoccus sp. TaxID=905023 RepID=UPI0025E49374|nr:patatin-like phospholipase family protein [uncultured Tessaracoccus sp.]
MRKGWFGLPFLGARQEPEVVSCTISGGGSRASFQIGALQYLYRRDPEFRPSVFVGASAGAIIASGLAQYAEHDGQLAWLDRLEEIWMGMRESADMFTPRLWYQRLLDEGPSWLQMVQPPPRPAPRAHGRLSLPAFLGRRGADTPPSPASPPSPLDPVEMALLPDSDVQPQWSLEHLSQLASQVGKLPRLGTEASAIWSGLERTQSMYRPGPVLQDLLEPQVFQPARVASSGMRLRVAMVALESGELRYMTEQGTIVDRDNQLWDDTGYDLVLGLLASCAIPGVFRAVPIDDETYVDGGTRENLPAELAIGLMGASRNYVISCHTGGVTRRANMADESVFSVIMRASDILIDEAGRDELEYAISAGATTIYPEVNVHDAMTVHPGATRINAAHGWFRAAETHLDLDVRAQRRHRRVIEQRMMCLKLEQAWLEDRDSADRREDVETAKHTLRSMLEGVDHRALPDDADEWWRRFERHPQPVTDEPWWD